jgi:hypothetical protein
MQAMMLLPAAVPVAAAVVLLAPAMLPLQTLLSMMR